MEPEDVDVAFFPCDELLRHEQDEWASIIAEALRSYDGTLTVTFDRDAVGWRVRSFLWCPPGSSFFETADPVSCQPLRRRVVSALRAAAKPVQEEAERG